jgi:hypothetical protein
VRGGGQFVFEQGAFASRMTASPLKRFLRLFFVAWAVTRSEPRAAVVDWLNELAIMCSLTTVAASPRVKAFRLSPPKCGENRQSSRGGSAPVCQEIIYFALLYSLSLTGSNQIVFPFAVGVTAI